MNAQPKVIPMGDSRGDRARVAARLGAAYMMRSLALLASLHDGDLMLAIIAQRITSANVAHLDAGDGLDAYPDNDTPPPDSERRPISISRLARSMGLPFETTRRYVHRLLESGACVKVKGGVIVSSEALERPELDAARTANLANLRKLMRDLRQAGIEPGERASRPASL